MKMLTVYTYAGCSTCKKATGWLGAHGIAFREKAIRETPPSVAELRTMLAAVGIIVYGQSYGFMQLYQAPRQMGFLAASAILIGFGFGIFIPTFQTMKLNMADRGHRGAVNSTFFTAFDIGVGTGMFLGGKIYAYLNLNWAFGTGALLNLLAIVYFYRISLDHYRKNKLGVDSD